ncbi:MAG: type II secretion system secretin GspD [Desulfamplus sp.]|nr:type II secretion system secretin GspD [Desulfamplus sp.]
MAYLMDKSFLTYRGNLRIRNMITNIDIIKSEQCVENIRCRNRENQTIKSVCLIAVLFLLCSGCASQGRYSGAANKSAGELSIHVKSSGSPESFRAELVKSDNNSVSSDDKNLAIFDEAEKDRAFDNQISDAQIKENSIKNEVIKGELRSQPFKTVKPEKRKNTFTPNRAAKSSEHRKSKQGDSASVKVELAFDNADLFEVLDATLFELFKVNYIIDPQVKAKVSFHFSGNYTKHQFIELLNEILQLSNLSVTHGPGDMYKVVRKNESAGLSSQDVYEYGLPDSSGDISRLIRLQYLDAASVLKSIQTFTSKGASISIDTVNNSVIVTDTLENVEKVINVLAMMDIPYFMDVSWRIFPVRDVEAKDIVQNITKLIKSAGLYYRPGALKGGYEILSIDSINAILVATRWPEILDLVDKWISAMDYLGDDAGNGTGVFVYFVENGTALEMADILRQLYGAKSNYSSSQKTQIVKPTERPDQNKNRDRAASKTSTVSGELSGDVEIIPDETNNAIIFRASQRDYKIIKNVLKELDVTPRQVLINVVIAEVTLTDKTQYGVQWLLNNNLGNYEGQGGLDVAKSTRGIDQVLGTVSNISYGIYNSKDVLKGLVTALGSDSRVNILSSPNIMAVDNKEAMIEVGEDVPSVTGSVTDINGGITNSVQYKKTGIILTVTPHVNSSGLVKMELSQEVSEKGNYDEALGNYSILTRKAETSLVVSDQQTILMGGLMRSNSTKSDAGVPLFKDIPVLGYLFKSKTDESTKTELIFLLTPHVVDSREAADRVTSEFAAKIESIKNLIETKEK